MESHRRFTSPVNFIKVILSDESRSTGIRLPGKFTDEYGKYLSEWVTLKVPNGDVWQVGLHKSGDEIWLKNGWGGFAERYDVGFSNLLMFKYEGCSTLDVVIFNASASEIEYPENKDHLNASVKRNAGKCPVSSDESETIVPDDDSSSSSEDQEHGIKIKGSECSSKAGEIEKVKADYKCHEPFMVYMNKSHLTNRGVYLPAGFRRKFLTGHKSNTKCLLRLKNDVKSKAWKVAAGRYLGNADWLMFVEDNGVKVGDVLVLEMIHKDKNALCVTICRCDS